VRKFYIQNFGCRATQADGAALAGLLAGEGLAPTESAAAAELVVLNTCTVTGAADEDVRKSIHRVHRDNPGARILVTGCYAQRAPEELSAIPGVTWVVGNSHKTEIAGIVAQHPGGETPYHGQIHVGDLFANPRFLSAPVADACGGRTRPNLKIQDGCGNLCTFCIIPAVRGPSRSMTAAEVVAQTAALAAGFREVVLTGINLGRWGRERGVQSRLAPLLRRLLEETGVERLRLSSIEPMDWTNELLELLAAEPRLAPHVHAPLQSASDAVLKRMKRRYRARHYEDRLARAHALLPEAAFGADVLTGFPGESEAEFHETYRFIERLPFTYLHVFTYSERPGTPAAALPGAVPAPVRKERTRLLRELGTAKQLAFRRRMLGQTRSAVTLDNGTALTDNYLAVELASPRQPNLLVELKLGSLAANGVREAGPLVVLSAS
jgi:threonylcarbamoyladenosine tRNA methylthiotransferase MtaB